MADYKSGHFYLFDMIQEDEITVKEIWKSVTAKLVCDAVFDSNNGVLWTLSGGPPKMLTKFTQNRPI